MSPDQIRELSAAMDEARNKALGPKPKPVRTESDMNATTILNRLKQHPGITDDAVVGVVSSFGKDAEIDARDNRTRDIVATLTTTDIDLDNEILVAKGANHDYLRENGVMFADHNYSLQDYVGDIRAVTPIYGADKENPRGWRVRFHVCDTLAGESVQKIVEHRGKIGISIGFVAEDYGPPTNDELKHYTQNGRAPASIVRRFRSFEGSATLLPCNVKCQAVSAEGAKAIFKTGQVQDELLHDVDDLVSKGVITREGAYLLGMPITPKRKVFAVSDPNPRRSVLQVYPWGSVG